MANDSSPGLDPGDVYQLILDAIDGGTAAYFECLFLAVEDYRGGVSYAYPAQNKPEQDEVIYLRDGWFAPGSRCQGPVSDACAPLRRQWRTGLS